MAADRGGGGGIAGRGKDRPAEFSEEAQSRLEPGRSRPLQSGREPRRRRCAVCFSRDLHDAALGAGTGAACAARAGAARICRRGQSRPAAVSAAAGAARRRDLRLAAAMLDAGEILPSAALDAAARPRSFLPACRDLERAGLVVRMPPAWRASRPPRPLVTGDRRCAQALGARPRWRCWTSAWTSRWTARR